MLSEVFERLERLDYLIRQKSTGTPNQLAERLNMSERTLYGFLNEMRELGAPIKYSRAKQTYYYCTNGRFQLRFYEN